MNSIVIENLNYKYQDGRQGLNNVNLTVEEGSRVALVGKNGSGKSTLLLHINGLLDGPGHIEVMGLKRTKKNMKSIRRSIGCLFNPIEYQFVMPDLVNDIMISLPGELSDQEKYNSAMLWLKKFNLEQYALNSPLELSSGEMKRAALAGVIAREPEVLLFDEPLNNIDRQAAFDLVKTLSSMKQTMLIATHRLLIAEKLATHIALMENGTIVDYCTAKKGLAKKAVRDLLL